MTDWQIRIVKEEGEGKAVILGEKEGKAQGFRKENHSLIHMIKDVRLHILHMTDAKNKFNLI
jgi:hypothetical protein